MSYFIYDGFDSAAYNLVITNLDQYRVADRNNQVETRANRNGGVLVQSLLGTKPIYIEGYFDGATYVDAQQMYDTLTAMMNRQERPLILPHAGLERYYTATPQNVVISNPNGLNRITFSFEFVVPEGSSIQQTRSTLINSTTIVTQSATLPVNVNGTVAARPEVIINFDAVSGGTGAVVTIRNSRDFVGLTIARNFVSGDYITINSDTYQLYINGVLTAPTGRFPTWEPGAGGFYYSDTFTSRSVDVEATYLERNL